MQPPGQAGQPNQPNPNEIKNPATGQLPQVKGAEMNERDYANEILATEKYLTDNFNVFTREASNQVLHDQVFRILQETHQASRNLFNLMFKKGWYQLTAAAQQELTQSAQQFQNYQTQFPY
ncbi:MAG TPA: spore coat protein [Bacillota bacterium]